MEARPGDELAAADYLLSPQATSDKTIRIKQ